MADQGMDRKGRQMVLSNNSLPDKVDLRMLLPDVRDQGMRSTCLAFAVTAAHELVRNTQGGMNEDLSEELLYWGCKQIDGDRELGSVFSSASTALRRWGQPYEETWPYDGYRDDTNSSYAPPNDALDPTICFKAPMLQTNASIDNIQSLLARGYVVALGVILSRGFFVPSEGVITMPIDEEELMGGHAVLVVGYENGPVKGEGFLILRNSWGLDWGDGGYGYLPYDYVERYGTEAWIIER